MMDNEKRFKCNATTAPQDIDDAVCVGFAISIAAGDEDRGDVRARFDALEIGETLVDEDGDTWERIA